MFSQKKTPTMKDHSVGWLVGWLTGSLIHRTPPSQKLLFNLERDVFRTNLTGMKNKRVCENYRQLLCCCLFFPSFFFKFLIYQNGMECSKKIQKNTHKLKVLKDSKFVFEYTQIVIYDIILKSATTNTKSICSPHTIHYTYTYNYFDLIQFL